MSDGKTEGTVPAMWAVKRDNVVQKVVDSESEAFGALLRMQSQSTDHAIKYEGWSISELGEDECFGCGGNYLDGTDPAWHHPEKFSTVIVAQTCGPECRAKVEALRSADGLLKLPEMP